MTNLLTIYWIPEKLNLIPSDADWRSEPWSLDTECAYEHFFGKSLPEAIALLEENALYYEEDLMFMPAQCLRFYIDAYMDYLLSDRSVGDSDGASSFFGLVEVRCEDIKAFSSNTVQSVKSVLNRLASQQTSYDAAPEIYGSFEKKAERTLHLLG